MLLGRSLIRRFILNNAEIRVQWGVAKAQWASNRCLLRQLDVRTWMASLSIALIATNQLAGLFRFGSTHCYPAPVIMFL